MKYSDRFVDLLVENGYTTVFYVAGGNIMHLLNSCPTRLECIPVIHEMSAVVAAEYFNESSKEKSFALVTAGPGLTNCVTGIAGAWLESRGVLIVGGQVKSTDLMGDLGVRQNGIQELNGAELVKTISKASITVNSALPDEKIQEYLDLIDQGRPGPVFLEFCLDTQGLEINNVTFDKQLKPNKGNLWLDSEQNEEQFFRLLSDSNRPVLLLGGGVRRDLSTIYLPIFEHLGIPIMTTWNGADRIDSDHPLYFGRPNTWGQRSSNIILQQSDLLIAIGTRLGLQQTGFNWQQFVPLGKVIQIDIDPAELNKPHPKVDLRIQADVGLFLKAFARMKYVKRPGLALWLEFAREVRRLCPLNEEVNSFHQGYTNPYSFVLKLSEIASSDSIIISCSSGGAFTTMMQAFNQKMGQIIISNKGLASMGYGLAGSIGAAVANRLKTVLLVEGDGGFAQNLQELGTAAATHSRIKIFLFSNEGYASIRMTQKNYFDSEYMGCDKSTGLGLPNWESIFDAYGIAHRTLVLGDMDSDSFLEEIRDDRLRVFIIPIHPEQTFFPKISSRIDSKGQMTSNPLHLMTPPLSESTSRQVFRYT
jgi:acetolactate synthase-1/2/3 large subunit